MSKKGTLERGKNKPRRDLYQEVTDKIIAAIEAGTAPWQRPWKDVQVSGMPMNGISERHYNGVNALLLMMTAQSEGYTDHRWYTMKQANDMGLRVRKGSKSTPVYFFKMLDVPGRESERDIPQPRESSEDTRRIPFLTEYRVFHASQIEDLLPLAAPEHKWQPIEAVNDIVSRLQPELRHGGNRAFYSPSGDFIQMPHKGAFADAASYAGTLLHELSHWSGHESRQNRSFGRWGTDAYAVEELRAELCSTFMCGLLGVPGPVDSHASYIESWVKVLRSDNREIFRAAKDARLMAEYLTGNSSLNATATIDTKTDAIPVFGQSATAGNVGIKLDASTEPSLAVAAVLAKARSGTGVGRSRQAVRRNALAPISAVPQPSPAP
jgi:antirestriction protein ArdC|uniref:ArdC family protein n=1 Tax=uncultured Acidovorax sp. TaxID=158751 RepID=UPI0009EABBF6|nr:zincin-like metallopeptidase domain-containing protein [uncultured Acidovorax sp.]